MTTLPYRFARSSRRMSSTTPSFSYCLKLPFYTDHYSSPRSSSTKQQVDKKQINNASRSAQLVMSSQQKTWDVSPPANLTPAVMGRLGRNATTDKHFFASASTCCSLCPGRSAHGREQQLKSRAVGQKPRSPRISPLSAPLLYLAGLHPSHVGLLTTFCSLWTLM
jgi:hypothetical protein